MPTANNPDDAWVRNLTSAWSSSYQALEKIRTALEMIEGSGADATTVLRLRAYAKFVQGVAHATVALLYDSGFVLDETTDRAPAPSWVMGIS